MLVNNEGRAILDLSLIFECINHVREVAECTGCGRRRPAVDGLPARGAWSRFMCGFVAALRAGKVASGDIARLLTDASPPGIKVSKSSAIDSLGRICDATRPASATILSGIRARWWSTRTRPRRLRCTLG